MVDIGIGLIGIAAGLAMGMSALAAAYGEAYVGSAAVGATAEDNSMFGKGLVLTVLPETLAIFGFVIAFLLLGKM
ncbi:MAG: ATPase [Thermoplasmata archaeon]|nr:ATPase [Thermoplasmata archaeon]NIS13773.1 ATPase [Thermoplasmata archaeon]NIS21624.1 ATPase [Thermoplasmata archaeon]NIT79205.1 ATPase [Thermoplasmata archaeon]NIU50654.1 ATPase [Thermoplasmata archaeon]